MSTKLKNFIDMNRQQMDSFVPSSNVWQQINTGMQQPAFIKSKISWLKHFGYSASAIIVLAAAYALLNGKSDMPASGHAAGITTVNARPPANTIPATGTGETQETAQTNTLTPLAEKAQDAELKNVILQEPAINNAATTTAPAETPAPYLPPAEQAMPTAAQQPHLQNNNIYLRRTNTDSLNVDTTFSGINSVELTVSSCDINVKPSNSALVYFKALVSTKERGIVIGKNDYRVVYERKDSVLKISLENKSKSHIVIGGTITENAAVNLSLPDGISLVITDSYGDVALNGIKSKKCELVTGSGDLKIENSSGDLKLKASYGDVSVKDAKGNVNADVASGDLSITNLEGNSEIKASYGSLALKNITGSVIIKSVSGDVSINKMTGDLDLVANYGNVKLENYKGNPKLEAVSGDITGKNVELKDGMTTKSSYGDISMSLVNDYSDLSFDLSTNYGEISIQKGAQPVTNKGKIFIQQGKILIKGYTSSGDQSYK